MELRHLRYFVAVAEELSVTRAANLLHMSQPALSRQIKDLEREIGVDLLERSHNAISLTEGGGIFLQECYGILRKVESAVDKVRENARSVNAVIRVGFAATPSVEILHQSLQIFQKQHPTVTVELSDLNSNGIIKGVRENKLDLGLTIAVSIHSLEGLTVDELGTYGVHVAFHKKHRFASMKVVPLAEVAREDLITFTRVEHPEATPTLRKILSPYTDEPKIVMECDGISSLISAVESGKGVAIGFETMSKVAGNRLQVKPLSPAPPRLPVAVIYDKDRLSDIAAEFVTVIKGLKLKSMRASKSVLNV